MYDRPFFKVAVKHLLFIVLALVALSISGSHRVSIAAAPALAVLNARTDPATATEVPDELDRQNIDSLVAVMDDEQVRRLLIDELKTQAAREQLALKGNSDMGGIAGFINGIKDRISFIRERIETLKTSEGVDIQEEFPSIYKYLGEGDGEGKRNPGRVIWSVILVFAGAMLLDWIFRRYLLPARKLIRYRSG
jgi:hypothetical protein